MLVSRESYTVFWNITFELENGALNLVSEHNFVSLSHTSACLCFTELLLIKSANIAREKQGLSRDWKGIGVNI